MRQIPAKFLVGLIMIGLLITIGTFEAAAEEPLVRSIVIEGNTMVDSETVKAAILKTKVNQPMNEQQILDDLRSIYDLGYFQDASASFDPVLGGVQVIFHVIENPIVNDLIFSGLSQVPLNQYSREMRTQVGYVLNVHDLWEDLYGLREWVANEHGFLVRVADLQADTDGRIFIELAQTKIKDIVIEGNEKTKDFVIERELGFAIGDPVNIHEVDRSLRNVLMLGFFDEIGRDFSDEDDPDETVLTINLNERKTGSATFGVSFSSNDGLVGFVEVADENFLGRGQRINATAQLGKKLQSYRLGFYEPYITKAGTSLGTNIYRELGNAKKEDTEFKTITNGGDITLGHPLGNYSRGRLTLKAENNTFEHLDGPENDVPAAYNNRILGLGYSTNTADHPFNPTKGFNNDIYLELATPILGGTSQYAKVRLEHSRYFEIKDGGYVLALRGLGGRTLAGTLKEHEFFRIGGADTLRGYSYGGSDGVSLTGNHMLVMNAEFRFPIVEKITGVVFTDWGTTWDDTMFSLNDLKNSYGLGVRLDTPIGLLRLDYGRGKNEHDERKGQFYFGIGQTF